MPSTAATLASLLLAVAAVGPWDGPAAPAWPGAPGTKLGTKDGRKIEPLDDRPPPFVWSLTRAGAAELPHRENRAGVRFGYESLDSNHYLLVAPEADVPLGEGLAAGLGLPLRLEFFNSTDGVGLHRIRSQDWDGLDDVGRTIRWFRWEDREGDLSLRATRLDATTLGRGAIVRRFNPNLLPDAPALSVLGTGRTGLTTFELFLDDLLGPDVGAARVSSQPFFRSVSAPWVRSIRLGATWASDFDAPKTLERFPSGVPRTTVDGAFEVADAGQVWAAGVDVSATLYDAGTVSLEPWLDASFLGEAGTGQTLGLLLRTRPEGAAPGTEGRFSLELRRVEPDFDPGYFDTFYVLSRHQLLRADRTWRSPPKYAAIRDRDGDPSLGWALEGAWSWGGRVGLAAGFEDAALPAARAFFLHGEARLLPWFDVVAAVHRRDLSRGEPVLQLGHNGNTLALALARIRPVKVLWLDASAVRRFELDRSIGAYVGAVSVQAELEAGWEF